MFVLFILFCFFFFFNDTATTEIYTLSLHDALPISPSRPGLGTRPGRGHLALRASARRARSRRGGLCAGRHRAPATRQHRSEEHTSELQSLAYLVCRLLLEKKKNKNIKKQDLQHTDA